MLFHKKAAVLAFCVLCAGFSLTEGGSRSGKKGACPDKDSTCDNNSWICGSGEPPWWRSLPQRALVSPLGSTGVEDDTNTHQDEQDGCDGPHLCRDRNSSKKSGSPVKRKCPADDTSDKKLAFDEC
jgi:hypothetical protein